MARNWFKLILICCAALVIPSCGTGQRLTAIEVTPATVVFGAADPALHAQLTAIGTYTHPPATKDITTQVTWTTSIPQVAQVTTAGLVSPTTDCGVAGITATLRTNSPSGNIITGNMSVTVDGPPNTGCPTTTP
jgi:hypothetical protein